MPSTCWQEAPGVYKPLSQKPNLKLLVNASPWPLPPYAESKLCLRKLRVRRLSRLQVFYQGEWALVANRTCCIKSPQPGYADFQESGFQMDTVSASQLLPRPSLYSVLLKTELFYSPKTLLPFAIVVQCLICVVNLTQINCLFPISVKISHKWSVISKSVWVHFVTLK